MFIRAKKRGTRKYLQIVESKRVDGKVRQTVHMTIGRLDQLQQKGKLDSFLRSGLKFSEELAVLDAHSRGECITTNTKKTGPGLLFEKLWKKIGIKEIIEELTGKRVHKFSIERAVFMTVLHRLFSPGSDRAAEKWIKNYEAPGTENIELHHLYRTMGWLGEPLLSDKQKNRDGLLYPLANKDLIEEELYFKKKNLFSGIDLVFFDTTSIYFEGEGGDSIGQYGHSKDHRPDLKQMVVGIVLDNDGNPICSELLPGNIADVNTLLPVAKRLKKRFGVSNLGIVADRGMISRTTVLELEKLGWSYILGERMRRVKEVRREVLGRKGRFKEIYPLREDSKDPSPLKVKEVVIDDRRYIVCHNEEQAIKDRNDRELIIESLINKLKQGIKGLVGNKGYRRYLKSNRDSMEIDQKQVKQEKRYDGKWVLRTNTALSAADVALKYKQLLTVEDIFRTMKSILDTRPIYHKCDDTIRGHVFCSFLALVLRKHLQDLLVKKGWNLEWMDIINDVDQLSEVEIIFKNKRFILRTEVKGVAGKVFQAAGIALPPVLTEK